MASLLADRDSITDYLGRTDALPAFARAAFSLTDDMYLYNRHIVDADGAYEFRTLVYDAGTSDYAVGDTVCTTTADHTYREVPGFDADLRMIVDEVVIADGCFGVPADTTISYVYELDIAGENDSGNLWRQWGLENGDGTEARPAHLFEGGDAAPMAFCEPGEGELFCVPSHKVCLAGADAACP